MSPRYYISTTILIGVLTFAISYWQKKQTVREIFVVFLKVVTATAMIVGGVLAIVWLLAYLGIAQSGFFL
ncbi:MAG TPA: hypothetical protein DE038_05750 [Nitrospina sp.]|nr:hypothetical protein [Nitrospina sp.]|tara:strand:+ start:4070 stop:4279 length:210 start_codon:yes stop_codon:yes gene_type:complete